MTRGVFQAGFTQDHLDAFEAGANATIAADFVPEPGSAGLLLASAAVLLGVGLARSRRIDT